MHKEIESVVGRRKVREGEREKERLCERHRKKDGYRESEAEKKRARDEDEGEERKRESVSEGESTTEEQCVQNRQEGRIKREMEMERGREKHQPSATHDIRTPMRLGHCIHNK